ncbi:MAG: helix-turn-helix domain-containing protein [Lachnospiraceae bacterium]|nr:helix-turn-helix domain-containing protein [Lachnospiraceae bacterium]
MYNEELKIYTVKELANVLRIGRDKAYALIRSAGFPSIRIGKRYFVTEKALSEWLTKYEHREYML